MATTIYTLGQMPTVAVVVVVLLTLVAAGLSGLTVVRR